jgi:hypothetical protein
MDGWLEISPKSISIISISEIEMELNRFNCSTSSGKMKKQKRKFTKKNVNKID